MAGQARRRQGSSLGTYAALGLRAMTGALASGLALLSLVLFGWMVARRIGYPYDLEWMEGGMLSHALRLSEGLPIYTAPSVDFVPHLYTPLYPMIVALIGKLAGVSYFLGRLVSVVSFLGAIAVGIYWAAREGGSALAALCAMALPVAAFADTGGFYDLVRCDSLQLFLTVAGAALAWYGRERHEAMAAAALILVAGFFAKQTAAPMIVFVGVGLLVTRRPAVLTFAVVGVVSFALAVYAQNRASDGWFWTYIFRLHQSHPFFTRRAFWETPHVLMRLGGPGLLLIVWAGLAQTLGRTSELRSQGFGFLVWLGLGGMLAACIAFGTQWAHINAYIPGVFFPSLAMSAAAGRLLHRASDGRPQTAAQRQGRALRSALVFGLLSASLAPRLLALRPDRHVPTAADRQAGDALIERLRSAPGEVLIPFHPYYAKLAGKRVFLHRMGIWDVRDSMAGPVKGLTAALAQQRFSRIIMDDKVEQTYGDWPELLTHYQVVERFVGPRVFEGARTVPALVLEPLPSIDRDLQ